MNFLSFTILKYVSKIYRFHRSVTLSTRVQCVRWLSVTHENNFAQFEKDKHFYRELKARFTDITIFVYISFQT